MWGSTEHVGHMWVSGALSGHALEKLRSMRQGGDNVVRLASNKVDLFTSIHLSPSSCSCCLRLLQPQRQQNMVKSSGGPVYCSLDSTSASGDETRLLANLRAQDF